MVYSHNVHSNLPLSQLSRYFDIVERLLCALGLRHIMYLENMLAIHRRWHVQSTDSQVRQDVIRSHIFVLVRNYFEDVLIITGREQDIFYMHFCNERDVPRSVYNDIQIQMMNRNYALYLAKYKETFDQDQMMRNMSNII